MKKHFAILYLFLCFSIGFSYAQKVDYFPERNEIWKEKSPSNYKIDAKKLTQAVEFAQSNEYSGSRDLRIAILKGFEREPFHEVLGFN